MNTQPLSNLQLELLKLYSTNVDNKDLMEIKRMLAGYFAKRAIAGADKIWAERGLTNKDMNDWLNE